MLANFFAAFSLLGQSVSDIRQATDAGFQTEILASVNFVNKDSLKINKGAKLEPSLRNAAAGQTFQFLRQGYYCKDKDSQDDMPVFNRTIGLKDSFAQK